MMVKLWLTKAVQCQSCDGRSRLKTPRNQEHARITRCAESRDSLGEEIRGTGTIFYWWTRVVPVTQRSFF